MLELIDAPGREVYRSVVRQGAAPCCWLFSSLKQVTSVAVHDLRKNSGFIGMPSFRQLYSPIVARSVFLAALVFGLASQASPQTAASGRLEIFVRDSRTGFAVSAREAPVSVGGGTSVRVSTTAAGRSQYELSAGDHEVEVAEPSHKALRTYVHIEPQSPLSVTIWLEPKNIPNELRDDIVAAKLRKGYTLIHGHVVNMTNGGPLAGARIHLENSAVETWSDSQGYFLLYAQAPAVNEAEEIPPADILVAEAPGHKTYRLDNILLAEGDAHYIVDMEAGSGTIEQDRGHKMTRSPEELAGAQPSLPNMLLAAPSFPRSQQNISSVTVPDSIRVGFNCTCRTCSTVSVYPLDEYVRLGLDDEWIASWRADSLRAGAVAYRSYGVYHVYHPVNPNYDICSTTCCQVNNPLTSSSSTDRATADTSGVIVVDSTRTNPFFAEYAAENNDHNCPDGEVGDAAGWPCMSDPVDLGRPFNGHGRGMCQWGTQRWSLNQQKEWVWITDHYYNNNGSPAGLRSGVIQWPGRNLAYVANSESSSVSIINTLTNRAIDRIPVDTSPLFPAITPDGTKVYVANAGSNTVSVIDKSSMSLTATIPAEGNPMGIAFSPDGSLAYIADYGSNTVSVVDTTAGTVIGDVNVGSGPEHLAVSSDGTTGYVTNRDSNSVSVIDLTSSPPTLVGDISVGEQPLGIVLNGDNTRAYVANHRANSVSVIDISVFPPVALPPIAVESGPSDLAFVPASSTLYVTNSDSNSVSVIDSDCNVVTGTIPVGSTPMGLAFTPDGSLAYVANYTPPVGSLGSISVIDTSVQIVVSTIPVEQNPIGIAIDH